MKNKFSLLILLLAIITIYKLQDNYKNNYHQATDNTLVTVTAEKEIAVVVYADFLHLGKSFLGFKEALGFKESRGDYNCVNTLGYLGKYQFGKTTLQRFNIHNTSHFLKNSEMQEDVFLALCSVNKWILKRDIQRKVGKRINGVIITESGILAASHLAGAGAVKKYLRSNGNNSATDAYGSSIAHYMKKFAGYDTSFIPADRKASI